MCWGNCRRAFFEWLDRKTLIEIIYMIVLFVTCILIIVFASIGTNTAPQLPKTCTASPCLNRASKILRFRNESANPCDNLYSYVCGNFLINSERDEKLTLEEFQANQMATFLQRQITYKEHKTLQSAKRLFQECYGVRERGRRQTANLKLLLEKVGGWPVVDGPEWNETVFDWVQVTYELRELGYPHSVFLDLTIEPDALNKSGYIFKTMTSNTSSYLYDLSEEDQLELMIDIALALGAEDKNLIKTEMAAAQAFWKELKRNHYPDDNQGTYQRIKLSVLQEQFGDAFNWLLFYSEIVGPIYSHAVHHYQLFPPTHILKDWIRLINGTSKRTQANYMMWRLVEEIIPYMHCHLRLFRGGPNVPVGDKAFCLAETDKKFLVNPMSAHIDRISLRLSKREEVMKILLNMKSAFVDLLGKAKWIHNEDRKKYVGRVNNLSILIGGPDNYYTDEIYDQMLAEMKSVDYRTAPLFEYVARANKNFVSAKYNQYGVVKSKSLLDKPYINSKEPKYIEEGNVLYIPGAIAQVYFSEYQPNYLNYGQVGSLVGKYFGEVVSDAVLNSQWSIISKDEFDKDITCLQKDFAKCVHEREFTSLCRDWALIIANQRIGEEVTYAAYKKWQNENPEEELLTGTDYTHEQLFWISGANVWCPYSTKEQIFSEFSAKDVFLSVSNNQNFREDFSCLTNTHPKCD